MALYPQFFLDFTFKIRNERHSNIFQLKTKIIANVGSIIKNNYRFLSNIYRVSHIRHSFIRKLSHKFNVDEAQRQINFADFPRTYSAGIASTNRKAKKKNNNKVLPILMPELDGSSFLAPQLPARLSASSGLSFSSSATEARPSHPQPKWGKCSACTWMQPRSASQTRDTCSPDRFMSRTRRDRLPEAWLKPRQRAFTTHSSLKSIN